MNKEFKENESLNELYEIEDKLRELALEQTNSEFKRRLLSARNILSNLINEIVDETEKKA